MSDIVRRAICFETATGVDDVIAENLNILHKVVDQQAGAVDLANDNSTTLLPPTGYSHARKSVSLPRVLGILIDEMSF